MIRFLLIRHGETYSNAEKRYAGHHDVGLNEKGIWQAEQLAERLAEFPIKAIYSSDLQRAIHTATIINKKHQLKLRTDPLLREINFGEYNGKSMKKVLEFIKNESSKNFDAFFPGGESLAKKQSDAISLILDLQKQWKEIGPVPRKNSEQIWKRFRAACDHFFNAKSEFFKNIETEHKENLAKKEALIEEIKNGIGS